MCSLFNLTHVLNIITDHEFRSLLLNQALLLNHRMMARNLFKLLIMNT